jgi:hypothetical protein
MDKVGAGIIADPSSLRRQRRGAGDTVRCQPVPRLKAPHRFGTGYSSDIILIGNAAIALI